LASTLFSFIDGLMAGLPGLVRLLVWALLAAAVSMALYRLTSPQRALQDIRQRRLAVQRHLNEHEGSTAEALPMLGTSLRLAFEQLLRVLWPTAVAAVPIILLLFWLDTTYGYRFPSGGEQVTVETTPPALAARLDPAVAGDVAWVITVEGSDGTEHAPLTMPVPALYKKQWWNALIGNPAGYLPDNFPVDTIVIDLPVQEYLPFGPDWLRAWYVPYFVALFAASLAIKIGFRII
jgi:hypothetical protein